MTVIYLRENRRVVVKEDYATVKTALNAADAFVELTEVATTVNTLAYAQTPIGQPIGSGRELKSNNTMQTVETKFVVNKTQIAVVGLE